MRNAKVTIASGLAVLLWASALPAIKVALTGYGVAGLSLVRLAVASATLAALAPFLGVRWPRPADLPRILVCGLVGVAAYQLLLNWGEVRVPAGTAGLLVATTPVFSAVFAAAFLRERLTPPVVVGSLVALIGSTIIALQDAVAGYAVAAWAVLGAAVVQAVYHCAVKPLLGRHTAVEVASYAMWCATAVLLPLAPAAIHDVRTAPAAATCSAVLLGVLPSALGFAVWGYAVARQPVAVATGYLYLIPLVALVLAFAWLDEVPQPGDALGGLLTLAGVALITLVSRRSGA